MGHGLAGPLGQVETERLDGLRVLAEGHPGIGLDEPGEGVARVHPVHLGHDPQRLLRPTLDDRRARVSQPVEDVDRVLGIREAGGPGGGQGASPGTDVAERGQLLLDLAAHRHHAHRAPAAAREGFQPSSQGGHDTRLAVVEVRRLPGVPREVEQLRARGVDELVAVVPEAAQGGPVHVELRTEGLGVEGARRPVRLPVEQREEAAGVRRRQGGSGGEVDDRRRDVDPRDGLRHHAARRDATGPPDDEGHAHDRLVEEHRVRFLPVLAQALPVVARRDDDDAIRETKALESRHHRADDRVGERDLAVVGGVREGLAVGGAGAGTARGDRRGGARRRTARSG